MKKCFVVFHYVLYLYIKNINPYFDLYNKLVTCDVITKVMVNHTLTQKHKCFSTSAAVRN